MYSAINTIVLQFAHLLHFLLFIPSTVLFSGHLFSDNDMSCYLYVLPCCTDTTELRGAPQGADYAVNSTNPADAKFRTVKHAPLPIWRCRLAQLLTGPAGRDRFNAPHEDGLVRCPCARLHRPLLLQLPWLQDPRHGRLDRGQEGLHRPGQWFNVASLIFIFFSWADQQKVTPQYEAVRCFLLVFASCCVFYLYFLNVSDHIWFPPPEHYSMQFFHTFGYIWQWTRCWLLSASLLPLLH